MWFNPAESGWGVTIADHETQLAVCYTYDTDGSPLWFTVSGGTFSFRCEVIGACHPDGACPVDRFED